MNYHIQAVCPVILPPRGYDLFLLGWALLGIEIMKAHGFTPLFLHDSIEFVRRGP